MEKVEGNTMIYENPFKVILLFSIPILFGNVFQQLYNIIDTAVIGNILGDHSLAAIGATAAIFNLVIGFVTGMTNGFCVVLARFYGADDHNSIKKTVTSTYLLTVLISCIITVISIVGLRPLLVVLHTPASIIDESQSYMMVILIFTIVAMFFNMFAGLLRAVGNSKIPLYSLLLATIVNIVLDFIFVGSFSMGIVGAAYATVISEVVSVLFCYIYIKRQNPMLLPDKKYIKPNKNIVMDLITTGASMGVMVGIISIGSVALQRAVNSFGPNIIAAHTLARKLDDILMLPLGTIMIAVSTYVSQNYGANRIDRVKKGVKVSILLSLIWSAICCMIVWFGGEIFIRLLSGTKEQIIIETANKYIRINIPFFFVLSELLVLRCSLQGVGKKIIPICTSVLELLGKFITVGVLTPMLGYLGVCIIEPITWFVCACIVVVSYIRFIHKKSNDTVKKM